MNQKEAREFIKENADRIVKTSRSWNNSMGLYSDSVCVWNGSDVDWYDVGIDFFDGVRVEVNKNTVFYQEYQKLLAKNHKKCRKNQLMQMVQKYTHHGRQTAIRIAFYLETLPQHQQFMLDSVLKVKQFRSQFRKNLCEQILHYINLPKSQRKYDFPISRKQQNCLAGKVYVYTNRGYRLI